MKQQNKAERFWDKVAKNSDKRVKKHKNTISKEVEKTKKHLNTEDTVLDYACGSGTSGIEISKLVKKIHAIDISSGMITIAKRRTAEQAIQNLTFEQSSIFSTNLKDESFNVITAFNILHLVEDSPKAMKRINELLKPGGLFISATPCLGEKKIFSFIFKIIGKIMRLPYLKNYKVSELENIIANKNFQLIETEILSKNPPHHFIVAKKI